MPGCVDAIYIAPEAGAEMKRVEVITALEGCGLEGDRYCNETGHWSRFGRVCEVTFIEAEDLDAVEKGTGLRMKDGEHRRNIVIRGFSLKDLHRGASFRVGEAVFEYRGPRSVCRYIERLTQRGMTQALKRRGGSCARVVDEGRLAVGDVVKPVSDAGQAGD